MANNKGNGGNRDFGQRGNDLSGRDRSIGNQQGTTQTGGQSSGGENRDRDDDRFTEDLRQSGDRNSSNKKQSS